VSAGPAPTSATGVVTSEQQRVTRVAAAVTVAVGTVSLLGWGTATPGLTGVVPGLQPLSPNAALTTVLLGLALAGVTSDVRAVRGAAFGAAGVAMALGVAALSAEFGGPGAALDVVLFADARVPTPQRMVPLSAAARVVLGLSVWLVGLRAVTARTIAWLVVPVVLLVALALFGQLFGLATPTEWPLGQRIVSPVSAVTVLVFAGGVLALAMRPTTWEVITSSDPAVALARRLLVLIWVVLAAIGVVRLLGQERGWYDLGIGLALMVVANGAVLSVIVVRAAVALRRQRQLLAEQEAATRFYERLLERRALELNDNVVQGLARAWLALELARTEEAGEAVRDATGEAQRIARELLTAARSDGEIRPGQLRRARSPGRGTPRDA
jgi:signal transduction histidine kinase